jgi:hypothetical protein
MNLEAETSSVLEYRQKHVEIRLVPKFQPELGRKDQALGRIDQVEGRIDQAPGNKDRFERKLAPESVSPSR